MYDYELLELNRHRDIIMVDKSQRHHPCPSGIKCRHCEHYAYDAKLGINNIRGSRVESGWCKPSKGFTYGDWWGWCDVNNPNKQNNENPVKNV